MVSINLAYTAPVNPPNAIPILTESQIWTGLKRKVKHAHEFVPLIVACEVESEEGNVVVRRATMQAGWDGPGSQQSVSREICVHMEPSRIEFRLENGSIVSNIVSRGPEGELFMTYSFEWQHQDLTTAEERRSELQKGARMAVEKSIDTLRRLVIEGEIQ